MDTADENTKIHFPVPLVPFPSYLPTMLSDKYRRLHQTLRNDFPEDRLIHDDLRTLAYGTDASFYRLVPKLLVKVENENDVIALLKHAHSEGIPLTFRAAGTSLSGQAVSDSVLALLGKSWKKHSIGENGKIISLQPGVIGAAANFFLAPFDRKIGPDPASINAAMIGGIVANNASGMCCGTAQNSYRTLESMKLILSDGTLLDTSDRQSRERFRATHSEFLDRLTRLANRVSNNQVLSDRIRSKYKMKNTTGFSLNALVDFSDPFEIIQHLMVGSEGTLGFIAEVTLRTVPEYRHKATALFLFPDIETACQAVVALKSSADVDAAEIMDRASLRSVESKEGMPSYLKNLDPDVAALLIETRGIDPSILASNIERIRTVLDEIRTIRRAEFTSDPGEFGRLWNIRKGLFPAVGAMRKTGTSVIIEDVAFPVPRLSEATLALQRLFAKHGYSDAIIFGHALEGNLHFVFNQDFNDQREIDRYRSFMDDVTSMVVTAFDGSLKAEHGTGRNMAPFVEFEWGAEAYALMKEIKSLFDPQNILNPGVIINSNPLAHLEHLKALPSAHEIIDKCTECGFCETQCPSKDVTLTPRQRIALYREIKRLERAEDSSRRVAALKRSFRYYGDETCATDGLCARTCPVNINTGELVKELRSQNTARWKRLVARIVSQDMAGTTALARLLLEIIHFGRKILGEQAFLRLTRGLHRASFRRFPLWNPFVPRAAERSFQESTPPDSASTIIHFPTCINRTLAASTNSSRQSLMSIINELCTKAGVSVIYPANVDELCCGMPFASKGLFEEAERKRKELEQALVHASRNGTNPVLVDMSPCLHRMRESLPSSVRLLDQTEFVLEFLADTLHFEKTTMPVAVHPTCSATNMGIDRALVDVASLCAEEVIVPYGIGCCGWAGDRGFTHPELNESALEDLQAQLPDSCKQGYSTSRTCEIGLSLHAGIPYQSILMLVHKCTRRKHG